ncbi:hypothetical protein IQ07DRAFT_589158 [Pyrenochaeta sp. DS3sAY3a]|nr:hypothetical protein IQ07DRAFT_589158 [Pyrenochaeta sp. DS3sAY3a]
MKKPGSGKTSRQRLSSTQTSSLHEVLLGVIVLTMNQVCGSRSSAQAIRASEYDGGEVAWYDVYSDPRLFHTRVRTG